MDSLVNEHIDQKFERNLKDVLSAQGGFIGSESGNSYVNDVSSAINRSAEMMSDIVDNNKGLHYLKGDLAEVWHTESANISSVVKGNDRELFIAPRDRSVIDVTGSDAVEYIKYQVKYYKTAEDTVKAISRPEYSSLLKLVPSDQLEEVRRISYQLYQKNLYSRPDQAANYLHTYESATDMIKVGSVQSKQLSEQEALQIVKEMQRKKFLGEEHGLTLAEFIEWKDILRVSGEAALSSAITSAALKMAPEVLSLLKRIIAEESLSLNDIKNLGTEFLEGGLEGAFRGGIAAFLTMACKTGRLGPGFMNVNPTVIGIATVVAINGVKNAIRLQSGQITPFEYVDYCLRDAIVLTLGITGATWGQVLIPVPVLGALVGNLVGTILAAMLYESSKTLILYPMISSGFTFFGLVTQDYSLPDEVLNELGLTSINLDKIQLDDIVLNEIPLDYSDLDRIDLTILSREFIKVDMVGYRTI